MHAMSFIPEPLPGLLGSSPAIRHLVERLPAIARARRTTLISGATGTGKEVVARALHAHGTAPSSPYIAVHCGALPENLIEAELFGHTRGAFTGATQARPGLIRSAHGGTLFLDEVDSLSASAQAKLLRFLESGEYRPVGSDRVEGAEAWVIAASNRDLAESVRRGEFREDLLYRLDVMRMDLPPLRLRGSDIELLAHHFLAAVPGDFRLSDDALRALRAHTWPGNVRELKHRIERAAVLAPSGLIDAVALGLEDARPREEEAAEVGPTVDSLSRELWKLIERDKLTLGQAVEVCEQALIRAALGAEAQNRTRAANRLGIHVRTIFKKMRGP
ncbi:sigma-54 dependent transcriptional regulator [Myxococcaceae bacterium GXIMD 01537]